MRPFLPALLCLSLLASAVTAFADPTSPISDPVLPNRLRPDILYTHRGEFVQVKPMRPLTLNAHVEQFAYDPLGIEIAVVGSEPQGENTLHFVKTVDARTGHEISRLIETQHGPQGYDFSLLRWSASGKYLLLTSYVNNPQDTELEPLRQYLRWDLSANPPVAQVIDPRSALPPNAFTDSTETDDASASPDGRWMEFRQMYHTLDAEGKTNRVKNAYFLYDPERDTFKPLTLPPGINVYSWTDNTHLKIYQDGERKQFDIITGQISPRPAVANTDKPAASKQYPDLSLDTEQRDLKDLKNTGAQAPSYIVWIRRTPFGKTPLGAAVAGLMPRPAVAAYPGSDDPAAMWSPTGKQVAFLANHDLYVSDLGSASGALPREKLAAGLTLDCADEQVLAESDLKQIGLGLIQFVQDNDENYPASADFMAKVYPFIKTMDVFSVGGHKFVYEQPADLSLRNMESPAITENGYIDLPCARVVLFADGHVRLFRKQETAP